MAKILTVDDEPLICKQIARILQRYGHEVYQAHNGMEALRLAASKKFDLALVDYNLPVMDGLEVLHQLRAIQPGCVRILVTGLLNLDLAIQAVNRGEVTRFVEKPFKNDRLIAAVDDALDTRMRMVEIARVQQEASSMEELKILEECLQGEFIKVALQPLISSKGDNKGQVFAFEALLRSTHPIFDGPLSIIRAAERHNKLDKVSEVIVSNIRGWADSLPTDYKIFMNIHPDELMDGESLLQRLHLLKEYSHRIVLEITERSRLQVIESWDETLSKIEALGFEIAIDDLGSGYSSLSVLADLQPKYIKMDMSIIRDIHIVPRKQRLVELMCAFADATNALVVGEGVEKVEELDALIACGVHLIQGFYLARPSLYKEDVDKMLQTDWNMVCKTS